MELPYKDIILPHTGPITDVRPTQGGSGFSTTALVTGEHGEFFVKGVPNRPGGRLDSLVREGQVNAALSGISPLVRWKVDGPWFVLGFEVVEGRPANYRPGEDDDTSRIVEMIDRIAAVELPPEAAGWAETRWDRFTDTPELLAGDTLVYTDIQPENILISQDRTWVVDWAWPTRGAAFLTPACFVVQLIAGGHTPAEAEAWVDGCETWKTADPEAIDAFARAHVGIQQWVVEARPEEKWRKSMLAAAEAWAAHRGVR
ncbi:protein kinase [Nocardiopsis sp. N85]|uniref:protein kinase n=1 Tax=Nocardiopsis sp. N85 TaxID=3029400 RepID=UPI00237F3F6D|nr:protein kinase [Nocardiopsis sp. N85]MDE3721862.1 protein kinase [Nocardiopsis sp. N85]